LKPLKFLKNDVFPFFTGNNGLIFPFFKGNEKQYYKHIKA
jgi:hypothetical protein